MTRRASPSAPMISIASTQLRTLPLRTERGPAALVATMPPDVANAPEDGSGGSRRPKGRAAAVSSAHVTEAPAQSLRRGQSGAGQWKPWLRRSEERRVGEECRSRWSPDHLKKKNRLSYREMSRSHHQ